MRFKSSNSTLYFTLQLLVNGQVTFSTISGNPLIKTVGVTGTIQLLALLPSGSFFATGDIITFNIPSPGSLTASTSISNCLSQTSAVSVTSCTITANSVAIGVSVSSNSQTFQVNVLGFKNPISTQTISGFSTTLVTSGGASKATRTGGTISGFQPDTLTAASLTPNSLLIGDSSSSLTITLTPKNTLSTTGRIYVDLPLWNPNSPNAVHMIKTTSPTCTGLSSNMVSSITCTYNELSRRLTLSGMIPSDVTGASLSFRVSSFLNPYSGVPKTGFSISTGDSNGFQIDIRGSLTVTVTEWASFIEATFSRADSITTVNERSSGIVLLKVNLPVDQNCRLRIDFPSDQPLTSDLTSYIGGNLFSPFTIKTQSISNNYIEVDGCPDLIADAIATGFLQLNFILNANQVKETASFTYSLFAVVGSVTYRIAQQASGITVAASQLTPGGITSFGISAIDTKVIQSITRFQVTLRPEHSIPTSSRIVITFPSSITLTNQASCTLSSVSGGISTSPGSCVVSGNVLTITNPFGTGSYTKNGSALSFIFSTGGTNPQSSTDAGSFTIQTFAIIISSPYLIDEEVKTNVYTPDPFLLDAYVISVSSFETYFSPSTYTLGFLPNKVIPKNGLIFVKFPSEITLAGSSVTQCQQQIGFTIKTLTQCTITSTSPLTVKIADAFSNSAYTSVGSEFKLLLGGLINPRTTSLTSSFDIATTDQSSNYIEQVNDDVTIKMTQIPKLLSFTVTPSSFITGETNTYQFSVMSKIPILTTDYISFFFPDQITLPTTLSCAAGTNLATLSCSRLGQYVKVILTPSGGTIAANIAFTFSIANIVNPPSTQATDIFTLAGISNSANLLLTDWSTITKVTMTTPIEATTKSLAQTIIALSTASTYTFQYTTMNVRTTGSSYLVAYPSTVSATSISTCNIIFSSITYPMTCTLDTTNRQIKVSSLNIAIPKSSQIQIQLGPIKNPSSQLSPGTFSLVSYSDSTYAFTIDKISSGLEPQFECEYPCLTCTLDKTVCTSCITDQAAITEKYLYQNKCYDVCPSGTYTDANFLCQECADECLACSNATTCLLCDTASTYPYLLQGWCYSSCPSGMCSNNFQCVFCTAPAFQIVSVSPQTTVINSSGNTLNFVATLTAGTFYTNNSVITFFIPSPGAFTPSILSSLCISSVSSISITSCIITANYVSLRLGVAGTTTSTLSVSVRNFITPSNTCAISPVTTDYVNSAGNTVAQFSNTTLSGFTTGAITTGFLASNSQLIGKTDNTMTITVTLKNSIPSSANLQIYFPIWNPSSTSPLHMIRAVLPTCVGVSPLKTSLTCTYSFTTQILTINDATSTVIAAGISISFTVNSFANPFSEAPKSGFIITTMSSLGCSIDSISTLTLQVTDWATLTQPLILRTDSITDVSEQSIFSASFNVPVPVDSGCRLRIYFPSDMPVTTALTTVSGFNIFQSLAGYQARDLSANYLEVNGCDTYYDSGSSAAVTLSKIVNIAYLKDTEKFQYELYDMVGTIYYKIARDTSGLSIPASLFTAGPIKSFTIEAMESQLIQDFTTFKLTFQPTNSIPNDSVLEITFPQSITLFGSSACLLSLVQGVSSSPGSCIVVGNVLKITKPFGATGSYTKNGSALSFIFSTGGTNPLTIADAGAFTVSTFAVISGTPYQIDTESFSNVYAATPAILVAQVLTVSDFTSGLLPTAYTLQLTPNKTIPSGGRLSIVFPTEISLASGSSLTSCSVTISGSSKSVTCIVSQTSPVTVQINNAFTSAYTTIGTSFTVALNGLQNPRTLATTSSFSITTMDTTSNPLESVTSGVITQMLASPNLLFTVSPSNLVNGNTNQYRIQVTAPIVMRNGDIILFTFPPEISLPSGSLTCVSNVQTSAVACAKTGTSIRATITSFSSSPLAANTAFSFFINSITNAPNTIPASTFTAISATDSSGNKIAGFSGTALVIMTTPASVQTLSLTQASTVFSAATTYTIQYTTINPMPSGSAFYLTYPSTISVAATLTTCQVVYASQTYTLSGCTVDTNSRVIRVSGGFSATVTANSSVRLILGLVTNPSNYATDSLTLVSYTDSTFSYTIDQIQTGLIPNYACTFPCKTCTATKTACLSCFNTVTSVTQKYLNGTSCLATCPTGFYADSNLACQKCPTACLTCADSSTCLTCNTSSSFSVFYNNFCYSSCPDEFFNSSGQCLTCDKTQCKTCNVTSTNCTSCDTASTIPFLQSNKCVTKCDAGYVSINFQCQKCTAPCATCQVTQTQCSSCLTGFIYGTTCISKCPNGTVASGQRCVGCDPKCLICSSSDPTRCLQCTLPNVLYNNTCYSACPDGYRIDTTNTTCLKIPDVPIDNRGGNLTIVDPLKKIYLYFPVLITQLILGAVAVGSWFKDKSSLIPSNCIALWAPLEFIAYGAQIGLAYFWITNQEIVTTTTTTTDETTRRFLDVNNLTFFDGDVWPLVFYGTCFAFAMLILMNIVYFYILQFFIRKDPGYIEYRSQYCFMPTLLAILGPTISFKVANFYYSRFFGLRSSFVQFENPVRFHTLLNILSIINIIFTLLPIIFIDIYGLIKYGWGSQYYIILIETLCLSVAMLVITIYEFKAQKTALKPFEREQMVFSALPDSSSIDDQVMRRMDEEIRKRFNGMSLEQYVDSLKEKQLLDNAAYGSTTKGLKRSGSMIDLGDRSREDDDRRVNTDPMDAKHKKRYDKWSNTIFDSDKYPDNCYADAGTGVKPMLEKHQIGTKIVQYGQFAQDGEDYDKDYDKRLRDLFHGKNPADERVDSRYVTKLGGEEQDFDETRGMSARRKNRMRGRKGKYYEQVDDEDQSFLNDQEHQLRPGKEDEEENLGMIEEESQNTNEENNNMLQQTQNLDDTQDQLDVHQDLNRESPQKSTIQDLKQSIDQHDKDEGEEGQLLDSLNHTQDMQNTQMFEEIEALGEGSMPEGDPDEKHTFNHTQLKSTIDMQHEIEQEEEVEDKQDGDSPMPKETAPLPPNIKDLEDQIVQEHSSQLLAIKEEMGETDSDDDDVKRIDNMRNPDKRRFNIHDILGNFDRDERGNIIILQDQETGNLIDKDGNRVNQKGYLIDEKTGDIIEKEKGLKVFNFSELDEHGELPSPYNLEQLNFNLHAVQGDFSRDEEGNKLIGERKNRQGRPVDRKDRLVNENGLLIDINGNLVDKRGRVKLHREILEQNNGDIPLLYNLKGKKYELSDIMGDFDKDRAGNIIIRFDKDGKRVDRKGRPVNNRGYLIDAAGNIINRHGKIIFDKKTLTKDNEPPKFFPFLKFNVEDIKGDYEMDPLGTPMLQRTKDGRLLDTRGRRVNNKGYLLDEAGNVMNRRGYKVFHKQLLEEDGDIPKLFRTGLLRKDTYDSFSQLMSEIEDLERRQEMDVDDPRIKVRKYRMKKEGDKLQRRIDRIVEEDNDDDDLLMKELEDLANDRASDGGNTSVESMMEDTPSNYNTANQRFAGIENIKTRAKRNIRQQKGVPEDDEFESEYSYLPNKRLRKKKKKKKKQPKDEEIDLRELMMAKAYGGLTNAQIDKVIASKKVKDHQGLASQMGITTINGQMMGRPPITRMASNSRMNTVQSKRERPGMGTMMAKGNSMMMNEDMKSDFEGILNNGDGGGLYNAEGGRLNNGEGGSNNRNGQGPYQNNNSNQSALMPAAKQRLALQSQLRNGNATTRAGNAIIGKTHSRLQSSQAMGLDTSNNNMNNHGLRKNNLLSDKGDMDSQTSDKAGDANVQERERRLSQIANSVSGFYKNQENTSDHSLMRSTHESNFAQNIGKAVSNPPKRQLTSQNIEEFKHIRSPRKGPDTAGGGLHVSNYDPEMERIYGTARGLADITMLSDWEKDSQKSGKSVRSQFAMANNLRVRGLENIYLQRLEPARKTALKKDEKPKFRIMHHRFHDEPEWFVDGQRDELDSVISDNYKQMEKKFIQEFQGNSSGGGSKKMRQDANKPNIFNGNFYQYKEKMQKERMASTGINFAQ